MRPEHHSRDIAQRCQSLIQHLGPKIEQGLPDDNRFGGPLFTTFLLAMATPMIVLPIERIFKPRQHDGAIADDRELNPDLADAVADVFSVGKSFGETPFSTGSKWRYVSDYPRFNLAGEWPEELLEQLRSIEAAQSARQTDAKQIFLNLRNALAHGGVTYLDRHGGNIEGPAEMLAFVAKSSQRSTFVNVLRIAKADFRDFLCAWADWLARSPVPDLLSRESDLAA